MRLSQLIYKAFTADGRDADRIRVTEARIAYNTARIGEMVKSDVRFIEWRAQPDCCGYCERLYKNQDGSYKKFPMDQFMRGLAQTGGLNKGVSKLAWSPYVVIAHPRCRCRPFPGE